MPALLSALSKSGSGKTVLSDVGDLSGLGAGVGVGVAGGLWTLVGEESPGSKAPARPKPPAIPTIATRPIETREMSPSQKSDVLKVVDFMVSASADMRIFSDVFPS